ncbi:MAG: M42 family metallopeptidase [Kosmotoga sp.]|nr:MAG: M42 family metallopeptidase [Kosmotoga sp.]
MKTSDLLMRLSNVFGPVGYEEEAIDVISENINAFADEIYVDNIGNLIAHKKGAGKKLAFFTHMDEIALVISAVDEKGYARFDTLGGIDPKMLIAQRVKIKSLDGETRTGIIGMLAPHLQNKETRKEVPHYDDLFIDISMNPDYEKVNAGDLAVIDITSSQLNGKVIGKALDDRACCAISILLAKQFDKYVSVPDIYFIFTTREEVGGLGAKVASQTIQPDLAVVMDVTQDSNDSGISMGKGPVLGVGGPIVHKKYYKELERVAKKMKVQIQYEYTPGRSGTDADSVQIAGKGVPTLILSIPQKHMHSPVEVIEPKDIEEAIRLLEAFAVSFKEGETNEV